MYYHYARRERDFVIRDVMIENYDKYNSEFYFHCIFFL